MEEFQPLALENFEIKNRENKDILIAFLPDIGHQNSFLTKKKWDSSV